MVANCRLTTSSVIDGQGVILQRSGLYFADEFLYLQVLSSYIDGFSWVLKHVYSEAGLGIKAPLFVKIQVINMSVYVIWGVPRVLSPKLIFGKRSLHWKRCPHHIDFVSLPTYGMRLY